MIKIIAKNKIINYLLAPRSKDDKSGFLALGGYHLQEWEILEKDILILADSNPMTIQEENAYGIIYQIDGILCGPNGLTLQVTTIGIQLHTSEDLSFVTLFPRKK